jgi:hypothetical protein
LDPNALSYASGSSLGLFEAERLQCNRQPDVWQHQAIDRQLQQTPYDTQQYFAAWTSQNQDAFTALSAAKNQVGISGFNDYNGLTIPSFEPWSFQSYTSAVAKYQLPMSLAENQSLVPVLPENQVDFTSATGPYDPFAGPSIPPASIAAPPAISQERFTCTAGCNKTFGRAGDWRRHMGKHAPPKFNCIIIGCDKTFYRKDKLKAHVRQGHKMDL